MSFSDEKVRSVCIDRELANIALIAEYGGDAWVEDLSHEGNVLESMRIELAREKQLLAQQEEIRLAKRGKADKELAVVETDFLNYTRNNEKTAIQVKVFEARAKRMYDSLKEQGMTSEEIDRLAESLLT